MSSITDFLTFVQPEGIYTELRPIKQGQVSQLWRTPDSSSDEAQRYDDLGYDVYYGVLPRVMLEGTATACTPDSTVLWADLDAKHNALGKKGCLDALLTFPVPASVIVDSGHGYHAYWKLDKAYAFPDCQKAMKGIAKHLGGDAVYDQPRVLRLPGTHNHKDAIPLPVRTIRLDETRTYGLDDFDEWVHEAPKYEGWHNPYIAASAEAAGAAGIYILATSTPAKGSRSEAIFTLILVCLRKGWEAPEIEELIWTGNIGEKAREKGEEQGRRWIQRSIQKAQRG